VAGRSLGLSCARSSDHECGTLEREAHCYRLARNDPEFAALNRIVPQCYAFDPELDLLISELLDGADLRRLYGHDSCPELDILLGETMACYQRELRLPMAAMRDDFPCALPWAFSLHQRDDHSLLEVSDGNRELLRVIRGQGEIGAAVDRLAELWQAETLIHGDMKWLNCIMKGGENPCLKIVDWEVADFGDGLWDAGAVLQEYR
jgi:hypothetical protein